MTNQSLLQSLEALSADFRKRSDEALHEPSRYPEWNADKDARERTWEAAADALDELIFGHYPRDECIHCHRPIYFDSHGTWIDETFGDVCGAYGTWCNEPHIPVTPYTGP